MQSLIFVEAVVLAAVAGYALADAIKHPTDWLDRRLAERRAVRRRLARLSAVKITNS